jgi:hypothetical protein
MRIFGPSQRASQRTSQPGSLEMLKSSVSMEMDRTSKKAYMISLCNLTLIKGSLDKYDREIVGIGSLYEWDVMPI